MTINKYEQIIEWAFDSNNQVSINIGAGGMRNLASDEFEHIFQALKQGKKILCGGRSESHLLFSANVKSYSIVQKMIKLGKVEFPKPISEAPTRGTKFYIVCTNDNTIKEFVWYGGSCSSDEAWLKINICHLTRENAQQHLDALNTINAGEA